MSELVLTLPAPPSVNALYCNVPGKGRVKTKAYMKWLVVAGWELRLQILHDGATPLFPDRVTLDMQIQRGRGDATNRIKAGEDLLVKHGVIRDDRFVESCTVSWSDSIKGMQITVRAV